MHAREIMSTPVICVPPTFPLEQAAELLAQRGFSALPVVDDDRRLIGIVSEADLVREWDRVAPYQRIHGSTAPRFKAAPCATVAEVMTTSVESFTPGADVADIASTMVAEGHRCLPIVDGDHLVGVVTRRDLLRAAVGHPDAELQRDVVRALTSLPGSSR